MALSLKEMRDIPGGAFRTFWEPAYRTSIPGAGVAAIVISGASRKERWGILGSCLKSRPLCILGRSSGKRCTLGPHHPSCTGQGFSSSGRGLRCAGRGLRCTGQGLPCAGRGLSSAGQGLPCAGQGLSSVGRGLKGTGRGLSSTGQVLSSAHSAPECWMQLQALPTLPPKSLPATWLNSTALYMTTSLRSLSFPRSRRPGPSVG